MAARCRLPRRRGLGGGRVVPLGLARPPGPTPPPGACLVLRGHGTVSGPNRGRRPPSHAPPQDRTRRQACGAGRGALRSALAPGADDALPATRGHVGARASPCTPPATWLPEPGATTTAPRRMGPCLRLGLGPVGVAALSQGTRSVWPGAVVPGLLFLWATPGSKAARSNPTPGLRRRQ